MFEERLKKNFANITIDEIVEILKNNQDIATNLTTGIKFLQEIVQKVRDSKTKQEVYSVLYSLIRDQDLSLIDGIFKKYTEEKCTRDELIASVENCYNSDDPVFVLASALCELTSLQDQDFVSKEPILTENLEKLKVYIDNIGPVSANSYKILYDLCDLAFRINGLYFKATRGKIILLKGDDNYFRNKLKELISFEDKTIGESDGIDIPPEALGLIPQDVLKQVLNLEE